MNYTVSPNGQPSPYYSRIAGPGIGFTTRAAETPYVYAGIHYVISAYGFDAWNNKQVGMDPEFRLGAAFASNCLSVEYRADKDNGTTIVNYTIATAGLYVLTVTQADAIVLEQNISVRPNPAAATLHYDQPTNITAGSRFSVHIELADSYRNMLSDTTSYVTFVGGTPVNNGASHVASLTQASHE